MKSIQCASAVLIVFCCSLNLLAMTTASPRLESRPLLQRKAQTAKVHDVPPHSGDGLSSQYSGGRSLRQIVDPGTVPPVVPTTPFQPVTQTIHASGIQFMQGPDQPFYFAGTNNFNLIDASAHNKYSVYNSLVQHWNEGVRVVRIFAFNNGPNNLSTAPIQEPVGVFHEDALQHFDYVVATAGAIGIRLLLCLTNHWEVYNGLQWYVDQTLGLGHDLEEFYTAPAAKDAYKRWVSTIIGRTNTVNGRQYKNDPTIFAWELCNECHTWDYYEIDRNMTPGQLLYDWEVEMIPYFRSLGFTQMLTNGAEGYRANTTHDSSAPTTYPFNNWINDARKGEDFVRNLGIPGIDFYGIHVYPDAWGANKTTDSWFDENYIGDRARLVHENTGKPIIMEECGSRTFYGDRDYYLENYFRAANDNSYAGALVWAVYAIVPEIAIMLNITTEGPDSAIASEGIPGYNWMWGQMGSTAVREQAQYMNSRSAGGGSGAPSPCQDLQPPCTGGQCITCAEQASRGSCYEGWMLVGDGSAGGYCAATYRRCK